MLQLFGDDFLEYCSIHEDYSSGSVENFKYALKQFREWFEVTNDKPPTPETVTSIDLKEYRNYLVDSRKTKTVIRQLSALSTYFKWAVKTGLIIDNPIKNVKFPREQEQPQPKWLEKNEVAALLRKSEENLNVARKKGNEPTIKLRLRDRVIFVTLLNTGLRVSELVNLEWRDVTISERKCVLNVRSGKGRKSREVELNSDARKLLSKWQEVNPGAKYVFQNKNGETYNYRSFNGILRGLGQQANLSKPLSPHRLRHTFGKMMADKKNDLVTIANLMGHSSTTTTMGYLTSSESDRAKAVETIAWEI